MFVISGEYEQRAFEGQSSSHTTVFFSFIRVTFILVHPPQSPQSLNSSTDKLQCEVFQHLFAVSFPGPLVKMRNQSMIDYLLNTYCVPCLVGQGKVSYI